MLHSHQQLAAEGSNTIVFAVNLHRLEPFLARPSAASEADSGATAAMTWAACLVGLFFGSESLPLWKRRPDSDLVTGRDRVTEIRLGEQHLTLAGQGDVDGEGDFGFDVLLPCPFDPECAGQTWAPVYSITDLYKALTGAMDSDPDIVCTVHGGFDDFDQEADDHDQDDPEGRADLQAQFEDAVA